MPVLTVTEVARGGLTLDPRGTGKFLVKIIDVGEGSSATYPPEALQLAEAEHIFRAGTHMYLDHRAPQHRTGAHAERSIRELASVLTSDATFDPAENALVAEAQAIAGYEETLESLAAHVGLSISATAEVDPPTAPGGKPVVRRILGAESVDWVTKAGRGGQVLAILESANVNEATADDRRDQLSRAVTAAYADRPRDVYAWLRDYDEGQRVAYFEVSDVLWAQSYTAADDDLTVTLTGARTEVRAVTTYVPVNSGGATTTTQEARMPEITEARLAELTESHNRVAALESERAAAIKRADDAEAKVAEAEKAQRITEARKQAAVKVAAATEGLAQPVVARITSMVEAQLGDELPADIDTRITKAVEAERAYLAQAAPTPAGLVGFGRTLNESAPAPTRTHNAFGRPITKEA